MRFKRLIIYSVVSVLVTTLISLFFSNSPAYACLYDPVCEDTCADCADCSLGCSETRWCIGDYACDAKGEWCVRTGQHTTTTWPNACASGPDPTNTPIPPPTC